MIASGLVANGCKVFICSRKAKAVDEAVEKLNKKAPGKCFGLAVDLAKEEGCKDLVAFVSKSERKVLSTWKYFSHADGYFQRLIF